MIHAYSCSVAQLDYRKQLAFPPAKVTFLNFQFVPVTAVMQLSETAWPRNHPPTENRKCFRGFSNFKPVPLKSPVVAVFTDLNDSAVAKFPVLNISETFLTIHISQVAVNGHDARNFVYPSAAWQAWLSADRTEAAAPRGTGMSCWNL